eukprot:scaffold67049_cov54-Phaeocystis_antarctica.AAC.1
MQILPRQLLLEEVNQLLRRIAVHVGHPPALELREASRRSRLRRWQQRRAPVGTAQRVEQREAAATCHGRQLVAARRVVGSPVAGERAGHAAVTEAQRLALVAQLERTALVDGGKLEHERAPRAAGRGAHRAAGLAARRLWRVHLQRRQLSLGLRGDAERFERLSDDALQRGIKRLGVAPRQQPRRHAARVGAAADALGRLEQLTRLRAGQRPR